MVNIERLPMIDWHFALTKLQFRKYLIVIIVGSHFLFFFVFPVSKL